MRFKKGSKEAKAYMAKIRAKKTTKKPARKKVGATLIIEKGESKKTKPKRVIQRDRTGAGTFKSFKSIGKIGSLDLNSVGKELIKLESEMNELKSFIRAERLVREKNRLREILSVKKNQFTALKAYLNTIAKFK